jgi:hypothetical protein
METLYTHHPKVSRIPEWMPRIYRGKTVFVNVDEAGSMLRDAGGRISMRYYKNPGSKVYNTWPSNVNTIRAGDSLSSFGVYVDCRGKFLPVKYTTYRFISNAGKECVRMWLSAAAEEHLEAVAGSIKEISASSFMTKPVCDADTGEWLAFIAYKPIREKE